MKVHIDRLRFLAIGGSLRRNSCSHEVLQIVLSRLRTWGCQVELFDVRDHALPFCSGDQSDPYTEQPSVALLRRQTQAAHGLIIATPEYHGGISGVMKNMLDLLSHEHLQGKVVGGVSVLGGVSNSNALNDLRRIVRWCHAFMIPEQLAVPHAARVLKYDELRSSDFTCRVADFARSLVRTTLCLNDFFLPELSAAWTTADRQQVARAHRARFDGALAASET